MRHCTPNLIRQIHPHVHQSQSSGRKVISKDIIKTRKLEIISMHCGQTNKQGVKNTN